LRLTANELAKVDLPASNILVIENEQCIHQLPSIENTIAILFAGLNLYWLKNPLFPSKNIIYWGDLATWGLKILALARELQPHVEAILMDNETVIKYVANRVKEPKPVGQAPRLGLRKKELSFSNFLNLRIRAV